MNCVVSGIPVTIEYRNVKNINLYVKPPDGRILITAPCSASEKKILDFIDLKRSWIEKARARILSVREREENLGLITDVQMENMKYNIEKYAAKWEPVMGVHASSFTIRDMKTRWGSCTVGTKRIRLNKRLAACPEAYLEYVLVHELCHLLEPGHNERFYAYMTKFMPDWKLRRRQCGGAKR